MTVLMQSGWPFYEDEWLGVSLDLRHMGVTEAQIQEAAPLIERALAAMVDLEGGALANPSEARMVGHYWLRDSALAPDDAITASIDEARRAVQDLSAHFGAFKTIFHVGIGGSALGPRLLIDALSASERQIRFLDNIDPDGIAEIIDAHRLDEVGIVVVSKSGTTAETMGALVELEEALALEDLTLADRTLAITCEGSALAERAEQEGWLGVLPLWDWVGGRTSMMSAVGLFPATLAEVDGEGILEGAARMDEWTRTESLEDNPALGMALAWYAATEGQAKRSQVILPYADRLSLLAPFLQQLIMESLGKAEDLDGAPVHQGLTVYGNKGATDQHAYVQQLREGPDDHFTTFVELRDISDCEAGDTLSALLAGTRSALHEVGRRTTTLSFDRFDEVQFGALIALFERAVGFYATFVNINAYDQPGVEAGKRCAGAVLALQDALLTLLSEGAEGDARELAEQLSADPELVFHVLRRLASNDLVATDGVGLERTFSDASNIPGLIY
ncbi:MAG: glucose-6-phosphate isomerase [Myxococcota bacterium]